MKLLKSLWLPRILAILYILFLGIFALDVFIPGQSLNYYLTALFIHLIPNFILLTILIIAWKWEKAGGLMFILAFLGFLIFFGGKGIEWIQFLLFSPLFLIGILFLMNKVT